MLVISRCIHGVVLLVSLVLLSACGDKLARLEQIGRPPAFEAVQPPTVKRSYRPVQWPTGHAEEIAVKRNANSLWQSGSRTFFRNQQARKVGDILKVEVKINDKADLDNKTERKRNGANTLRAPNVFGLENKLFSALPGTATAANLLNITNTDDDSGEGVIARKEKIETTVAAMVTQILPNRNLVINGRQEIRVNHELREITIEGIIRPEDIGADNSVRQDQIAEVRISYGGRGQISDIQQPRYGKQVLDVLSPF